MRFTIGQLLTGGSSYKSGIICNLYASTKVVWTAQAPIWLMLADMKVGTLGGTLVILLA